MLHSRRREIKLSDIEPAGLRADINFVAPTALQNLAQNVAQARLGKSSAVIGAGVDQVHAGVDRGANARLDLGRRQLSILFAESCRSLTEDGDLQAGAAKFAVLHGWALDSCRMSATPSRRSGPS